MGVKFMDKITLGEMLITMLEEDDDPRALKIIEILKKPLKYVKAHLIKLLGWTHLHLREKIHSNRKKLWLKVMEQYTTISKSKF